MPKSSEEISKNKTTAVKTDSNISNDALHLGGIPAEDFATQSYVQQYHGSKEELQKEYIDNQDATVLSDAKLYTDTVVANQDFSRFAKVTDVQRLDDNLTAKINTDVNNLSSSVDNKIDTINESISTLAGQTNQNINRIDSELYTINQTEIPNIKGRLTTAETNISNISQNITNINNDIDSLEDTTEQLFTSVSSGKNKVATAITDKGVTTASDATFDTMANNIRQIETGIDTSDASAVAEDVMLGKTAYAKGRKIIGIHIDSGIDTSDATATADDIIFGKTAYVDGSKIYGVHEDLDTSDATATQDDITIGKSAYINGNKIYGLHIDTGTDTTDATATPYDIVAGKTAYVNGEKITGILDMSGTTPTYCSDTGVEKVYGGGTGAYTVGNITGLQSNGVSGILYNSFTKEIVGLVREYGNSEIVISYITDYYIDSELRQSIGFERTINISSVIETAKQMLDYEDSTSFTFKIIGITLLNTNNPYIALLSYDAIHSMKGVLILLPLIEVHETNGENGGAVITWNIDFENVKYHALIPDQYSRAMENFEYRVEETGNKIVLVPYYPRRQ